MTRNRYFALSALALVLGVLSARPVSAQSPESKAQSLTMANDGLTWGPAPAIFPTGAQMAVVQGDPSSKAMFAVRFRFPDGYRLAPHTHPSDENVTVIRGTFRVGMGKTVSTKDMMTLTVGGFVTAPANMAHYAIATGVTEVQVHAMGPFALTYVNPADIPKAAK